MANQYDIKKYLMDGTNPYLEQDNRNGEILMLSGVWGSGKTYFWKKKIEKNLIKMLEDEGKDKSYVFISLYGKDSIEELQNEIQQLSYHFSSKGSKSIISSTFSVFTKVASFMPKISFNAYGMGVKIDTEKTVEKLEEENIKQQIEKGVGRLKNGGIVCFDDFERKSSKIDLNDLFGFITNLTEEFKTKTIIITNQEFFKEKDSEVFSRIKEKSINKFLLLNPTVDELFEIIYKEKYMALDDYKDKILEVIKITEEKNARIYKNILENFKEYLDKNKNITDDEIRYFVLTIINFNLNNIVFKFYDYSYDYGEDWVLPSYFTELTDVPIELINTIERKVKQNKKQLNTQLEFIDIIKSGIELKYKNIEEPDKKNEIKPTEKLTKDLKKVDKYADMIWLFWKLEVKYKYREQVSKASQRKINTFIETGILHENEDNA